jgi:hypothetical protein
VFVPQFPIRIHEPIEPSRKAPRDENRQGGNGESSGGQNLL